MTEPLPREWDISAYFAIRRRRDALVAPVSRRVAALGVAPSAISVLGVVLAASLCWTLGTSLKLALLAFLLALACDALDGAVARLGGSRGAAGKIVDHACDLATFLLTLLAIEICDLGSSLQVSIAALFAAPLLLVAISRRRCVDAGVHRLSGGMLAHLHKVPIYFAVLAYTAAGANYVEGALQVANVTAAVSLVLLATSRLVAGARPPSFEND